MESYREEERARAEALRLAEEQKGEESDDGNEAAEDDGNDDQTVTSSDADDPLESSAVVKDDEFPRVESSIDPNLVETEVAPPMSFHGPSQNASMIPDTTSGNVVEPPYTSLNLPNATQAASHAVNGSVTSHAQSVNETAVAKPLSSASSLTAEQLPSNQPIITESISSSEPAAVNRTSGAPAGSISVPATKASSNITVSSVIPSASANQTTTPGSLAQSDASQRASAGTSPLSSPRTTRTTENRSVTAHPTPNPAGSASGYIGESIYGTIMKRLASLEHNATLTLQYTEDQTRLLQAAIARLEARLIDADSLVGVLLDGSRPWLIVSSLQRYQSDLLIKQIVRELEQVRARTEKERLALAAQMDILANAVCLGLLTDGNACSLHLHLLRLCLNAG